MIVEVVEADIRPGSEAAFEAAYAEGALLVKAAKGCLSVRLLRAVERPNRYRVVVEWETLESHTENFRGTLGHQRLRELIRSYFERPAHTEHHHIVLEV